MKYPLLLTTIALSVGQTFAITGDQLLQNIATALLQPILQLMIVIAVLYFLYGIVRFIWAAREGKEDDMNKGKMHLLWGTIGLFIMLSIGGILRVLNSTIGGMF